jgi:transcriptional regulator with GAF, ATPase, and Fis domain
MLRMAEKSPETAGRFVSQKREGRPEVRMEARFVDCLLRREYPTNVRDLSGVLWNAVYRAPGDTLVASRELVEECRPGGPEGRETETEGGGLTKERVGACLERHRWLLDPAAKELRLTNRYALRRLMKQLGIAKRRS